MLTGDINSKLAKSFGVALFFFLIAVILGGIEINILLNEPEDYCPRLAGEDRLQEQQQQKISLTIHATTTRQNNNNIFNKYVLGNSLKFEFDAYGIMNTDNNTIYEESYNAIENMNPGFIVFPGGYSANTWRWNLSIPQNRLEELDIDGISHNASFGLFEFLSLCDRLASEPVLIFNVHDGTREELQALIAYVNGASNDTTVIGVDSTGTDWQTVSYWASQRETDRMGVTTPFMVKYIELGYEVYNLDYAPYEITAEDYSALALDLVVAAKTIDPLIKVGISVAPGAYTDDGAWNTKLFDAINSNDANATLFPDGLSVHIWNDYERTPFIAIGPYVEDLTTTRNVENTLGVIETQLSSSDSSKVPRNIWVSAYARRTLLWYMDHDWLDALALTEMIHSLMNYKSDVSVIEFAAVYTMADDSYGVFDTYSSGTGDAPYLHPSYFAITLISSVFNTNGAADYYLFNYTTTGVPNLQTSAGSSDPSIDLLPYSNGTHLSILIINKACVAANATISLIEASWNPLAPVAQYHILHGDYKSKETVLLVDGDTEDNYASTGPKWQFISNVFYKTEMIDVSHKPTEIQIIIPRASISIFVAEISTGSK